MLDADFAAARAKTEAFDRSMAAAMGRTASTAAAQQSTQALQLLAASTQRATTAAIGLSAIQQKLVTQMVDAGVSAKTAAAFFGVTADAEKMLIAFNEQLAAAQAKTTGETLKQTAALKENTVAGNGAAEQTLAQARALLTPQLRRTQQQLGGLSAAGLGAAAGDASAADTQLAFQKRMTKQRIEEAEAEAAAVAAVQAQAESESEAEIQRELTLNQIVGKQKVADAKEAAAAQQTADREMAAFRTAMDRQRADEEKAEATQSLAGLRQYETEEQASARRVASFQRAMAAQRAREEAREGAQSLQGLKKYEAEQATLAARAETLRASLDPAAKAQQTFTKAVAEADALLAAGAISEAEYAAAIKVATAALAEQNEVMINGRVVTEGLAAVHEVLQGRTSRLGGTLTILGQALLGHATTTRLVTAAMSPMGLAIIATTVAVVGATAAVANYENALRQLRATSVGSGAASGISSASLEQTAQRSAPGFSGNATIGIGNARSAAESYASAGVSDPQTLHKLVDITNQYAELTGKVQKFGFTATDTTSAIKAISAAIGDLNQGTLETNKQLDFLTIGEKRDIDLKVQQGDLTGAQAEFTNLLATRTVTAANAANGLESAWTQTTRWFQNAASAGAGLLDVLTHLGENKGQQAARAALEAAVQGKAADVKAESLATDPSIKGGALHTPESDAADQKAELQADADRAKVSLAAAVRLKDTTGITRLKQDVEDYTNAAQSYLSAEEKVRREGQLQVEINTARHAKNKQLVDDLTQQKNLLQTAGEVMSTGERQTRAKAAGDVAASRGMHGSTADPYGDALGKANEAASGSVELANAYLKGGDAAIRAEAAEKALTEAVGKHWTEAQKDALIQAQINKDVAEAAAGAGKKAMTLTAEAHAQTEANTAVEAGTMTSEQAQKAMRLELELRPMLQAMALAEGDAKKTLKAAIDQLTGAYKENNAAAAGRADAQVEADKERVRQLQLEVSLLGQTSRARGEALARDKATVQLRKDDVPVDSKQGKAVIGAAVSVADAQSDLDSAKAIDQVRLSTQAEVATFKIAADTYGMTTEKALAYQRVQAEIIKAQEAGRPLTDEQIAQLQKLADGYAKASTAATELARQQKGAADAAKSLTDETANGLESIILDGKSAQQALHDMVHSIDKNVLDAAFKGEGPFAGLLGTNKTPTEGGSNQGVLSQVFGGLFGVGSGGDGKPKGTASDPVYTKTAEGLTANPASAVSAVAHGVGSAVQGIGSALANGLGAGKGGGGPLMGGGPSLIGGLFGAQSAAPPATGAPAGGLASGAGGLVGAALGLAGGLLGGNSQSKAPTGASDDPFYVKSVDPAGAGGAGGILSSILGGGGSSSGGGIMSLLGGGGGSAAGGISDLAGLFHTGTSYVGNPGRSIPVSPNLFIGAPRLHSGLAPDEFPAILQHGEEVIPRGGKRRGGKGDVHIHLSTPDAASFGRSKGQLTREMKRQVDRI